MKKKLGISLWTGMGARNLIHSGVLSGLNKKFYVKYYSTLEIQQNKNKNISVDFNRENNFFYRVITEIQYYSFWFLNKPETVSKYMKKRQRRPLRHFLFSIAGIIYIKLFKSLDRDIFRDFAYRCERLDLRGLDVMFLTSTDVVEDRVLLYAAKIRKIPTVVLVHSWDNLPSRGMLATYPTKLLVWNEIMQRQAVEMHGMNKSDVQIVGVPQYEYYRQVSDSCDENNFRQNLKIPAHFKIVLYTASATRVFPDEEIFIEKLSTHIQELKDTVLILRLHPEERRDLYLRRYSNNTRILLSVPDDGFRATVTNNIGNENSVKDFVSLIKFSSVVINLASTITLDALLFDKPVICPAFNFSVRRDEWNAAHRWYESTHFGVVTRSGAIEVAATFEELKLQLQRNLGDPGRISGMRGSFIKTMAPILPTSTLIQSAIEGVC